MTRDSSGRFLSYVSSQLSALSLCRCYSATYFEAVASLLRTWLLLCTGAKRYVGCLTEAEATSCAGAGAASRISLGLSRHLLKSFARESGMHAVQKEFCCSRTYGGSCAIPACGLELLFEQVDRPVDSLELHGGSSKCLHAMLTFQHTVARRSLVWRSRRKNAPNIPSSHAASCLVQAAIASVKTA